jgi:integrase
VYWQVALGSEIRNGRRFRLRRTFLRLEEAETFARLKRIERTNRGTLGVSMDEKLRGDTLAAVGVLAPYGGVTVLDAARYYARQMEVITHSETVSGAITKLLAAKQSDGLSPRYLGDLRDRLGRFSNTFGPRKLADIAPMEIDRWLRDLGLAPLTRNSFHMRLHTLFEFGRQCRWLTVNPMADVSRAKVVGGTPGILTVEQAARLLESASAATLSYHAIGLFCGLRSAELERLEWRDVHFGEGLVEVTATKSKTASRRLIPIRPNLAAWLAPYHGCRGMLCPLNLPARLFQDRQRAGIIAWPSNALRHSFASYHLAHFKNAAETALELGHTNASITFRHYRELVRPVAAAQYWQIAPAVRAESITVVA